jgi:hypothetical protein
MDGIRSVQRLCGAEMLQSLLARAAGGDLWECPCCSSWVWFRGMEVYGSCWTYGP